MATRRETADALKRQRRAKKRADQVERRETIPEFNGENRWLSNFAPLPKGLTNEHLYQACKGIKGEATERVAAVLKLYQDVINDDSRFHDPNYVTTDVEDILVAARPGRTKRLGNQMLKTDADHAEWEAVKVDVMRLLLRHKFAAGTEYAQKLMDTGEKLLIEGNTWGDVFWGKCKGEGKNVLGKLLMQVRYDLFEQQKGAS